MLDVVVPAAGHRPTLRRATALLVAGALALTGAAVAGTASRASASTTDAAGARLTWAPPTLTAPTTIQLTASNRSLKLDMTRDYVVRLPATPLAAPGGVSIYGGNDVVLIGGQIDALPDPLTGARTRGLYLRDQTGTIHVEGVRLAGPGLGEGINLDQRLGAVVQLQNVRVETVTGSAGTNHADVLQTWAGPRRLHVDKLSGSTTYQGFFLLPQQFGSQPEPEVVDLRRVDLTGTDTSGYLLWRDGLSWPLTVDRVHVSPKNPSWRDGFLWPKGTLPGSEAWPYVTVGAPSTGEFVPAGAAGVGYTTPGYLSDPGTVAPVPEPTPAPAPEPTPVAVAPAPEPTPVTVAPAPEPTVTPAPEPTLAPEPQPTTKPGKGGGRTKKSG